ncbi:MAG: phage tail sheath family protein [Rhodocyclaceae bacterium]|nr:phage tail sheath family protein [Rhodocyclaceae bacterium]
MTDPRTMKTPGVYIAEQNAFPSSVVQVPTAEPAFIGYTEKAEARGKSLRCQPTRITSLAEFESLFGAGPGDDCVGFRLDPAGSAPAVNPDQPLAMRDAEAFLIDQTPYRLTQTRGFYWLYACMRQFFENGGWVCHVVSVGSYRNDEGIRIDAAELAAGLASLDKQPQVTLVVVPEAVLLPRAECHTLQRAMLAHCGALKNRFAILDLPEGYRPIADCIAPFRSALGTGHLDFGAAYYPWLHTTILEPQGLSHACLDADSRKVLIDCVKDEFAGPGTPPATLAEVDKIGTLVVTPEMDAEAAAARQEEIAALAKTLNSLSRRYAAFIEALARRRNLLPPAAALAGIYTLVDNSRGVWHAPANLSVTGAVSPAVEISDEAQQDLNVDPTGKSVNAIRSFPGMGTMVWGARTLDGNSLDWRYVPLRRTVIMLEESIRLALKAYVFEANVGNTWVTIRQMLQNFLTTLWKQGGLSGAAPEEAFAVSVGLGETMTAQDILEGTLRVTVMVALTRPAEFFEMTFEQTMQTA